MATTPATAQKQVETQHGEASGQGLSRAPTSGCSAAAALAADRAAIGDGKGTRIMRKARIMHKARVCMKARVDYRAAI